MHSKLLILVFVVFSKSLFADCWSCYELYEATVITSDNHEHTGILSMNNGQKETYLDAIKNKIPLNVNSFFNSNYFPSGYISLRNDLIVVNKKELGIVGGFFQYYIVGDGRKDVAIQINDIKSVTIIRNMDYPYMGSDARMFLYYDDGHPFSTRSIPTQVISIDSDSDYATYFFLNFGAPHEDFNNEIMRLLDAKSKEELFAKFSYDSSAKSTRILYENDIVFISEWGD